MVTDSNRLLGHMLGTCVLERPIGRGGMGAVYIARQLRPRRSVAVKVLLPGMAFDEKAQEAFLTRFRREADAIAALDHIHIMPIYEYGEQDQLAYLVMPYVAGGTLRQILTRRGSLPLNEALPIIEQAAEALDYAHERGIIHRDIKPGNILFHADGRLLLADFGLAKVLSEATQIMAIVTPESIEEAESAPQIQSNPTFLSEGAMIGTPEYLSPEQALGTPVDGRTDIYSLGVVLFQILSGEVPFVGETPLATAVMHTRSQIPSISARIPTISLEVEEVLLRAMAKEISDRYATAGEFARALRLAAEGHSSSNTLADSFALNKPSPRSTRTLLSNDTVPEMSQVDVSQQVSIQEQGQSSEEAFLLSSSPTVPNPTPRKHNRLLMIVACLLVLFTIIGGSIFAHLNQLSVSPPLTRAFVVPSPTSLPTPAPTETPVVTFTPTPLIRASKLLYASSLLYSSCNGEMKGWSKDPDASVFCERDATNLTNTSQTGGSSSMAGVFLNSLPDGKSLPKDYVLQVQARQVAGSSGEFSILFRKQTSHGNRGSYALLILPNGTWQAVTYDRAGNATTLTTNNIVGDVSSSITIDILAQGDTFHFYINGFEQGGVKTPTYTSGSIGVAVSSGSGVLFQNLALYQIS